MHIYQLNYRNQVQVQPFYTQAIVPKKVEIISREDIRPSSPTPSHLRVFKLSLLDHLIPSPYAPIILFYTSQNGDTTYNYLSQVPKRVELLKKSLSETLTLFYPLGGKIKEDMSIECNDEGANFVQAQVKCSLDKFLVQPQLTLLHKFLPIVSEGSNSGTYVTNIQVNIFECGGIAIGMCISHRILDGAALSTFIKGWTERAKGCNKILTQPNFIASSLFPTSTQWFKDLSMCMWGSLLKQGKWVTKRFLFRNSDISTLKDQTLGTVANSTRLEIVSAMLWKSLMAVSKTRFGTQRPSLATHLVNLRRRMDEANWNYNQSLILLEQEQGTEHESISTQIPLLQNKALCPEHAMGNLLWLVAAKNMSDREMGLGELVGKLRSAITRVDSEFVQELRGEKGRSIMEESLGAISEMMGSKSEVDHIGFSSWCNFGFYEADFGWGKPTWVSSVGSVGEVFMNLVILVDTRLGDGIETWVTLEEQDMTLLEANTELLACATLDPSPFAMSSVA